MATKKRRTLGSSVKEHTKSTEAHMRGASSMLERGSRLLRHGDCKYALRSLITANGHIQAAQQSHRDGRGGGTESMPSGINQIGNAYHELREKSFKLCVIPLIEPGLAGRRKKARR